MENRQAELSAETAETVATIDTSAIEPPAGFQPPAWDDIELHVLETTAAMIAARGIDGVNLTALSRESKVSRPTIYRRWSGIDEIVRAALLRSTIALFERLGELPGNRAALSQAVVRYSVLFREDPLFSRLLEREPEVFTRYSLQRIGSSQRYMLRWIEAAVAAGQRDASVRTGSAADIAVMLLLIAQSATLSHRTVAPLIGEADLDRQLGAAVDGYLRP